MWVRESHYCGMTWPTRISLLQLYKELVRSKISGWQQFWRNSVIQTLSNSSTYYGSWMVDHFCICRRLLLLLWMVAWMVCCNFVSYLCDWKLGWLAGCLYYWLILTIVVYWEYLTTWLWEKERSCSGLEWWWMAGPRRGLLSANLILGIWIWHQAYHYWVQCYVSKLAIRRIACTSLASLLYG